MCQITVTLMLGLCLTKAVQRWCCVCVCVCVCVSVADPRSLNVGAQYGVNRSEVIDYLTLVSLTLPHYANLCST